MVTMAHCTLAGEGGDHVAAPRERLVRGGVGLTVHAVPPRYWLTSGVAD
jgi:hypothetical protein